ncbi:MAG: hypothetical protein RIT04_694 [Candidatus Parcubacteria bacterium]|jgi:hypothetical protein
MFLTPALTGPYPEAVFIDFSTSLIGMNESFEYCGKYGTPLIISSEVTAAVVAEIAAGRLVPSFPIFSAILEQGRWDQLDDYFANAFTLAEQINEPRAIWKKQLYYQEDPGLVKSAE